VAKKIKKFEKILKEQKNKGATKRKTTNGGTKGGGGGLKIAPPPLYFLPKNNFHLVTEVKNGK